MKCVQTAEYVSIRKYGHSKFRYSWNHRRISTLQWIVYCVYYFTNTPFSTSELSCCTSKKLLERPEIKEFFFFNFDFLCIFPLPCWRKKIQKLRFPLRQRLTWLNVCMCCIKAFPLAASNYYCVHTCIELFLPMLHNHRLILVTWFLLIPSTS